MMLLVKHVTVLLIVLACSVSAKQKSNQDGVALRTRSDGGFEIDVMGTPWLRSGPTWFAADGTVYSSSNGTLKMSRSSPVTGRDDVGTWNGTASSWKGGANVFTTTTMQYHDAPVMSFSQYYMGDTAKTNTMGKSKAGSGFPTFQLLDTEKAQLGYYAPRGYMYGDDKKLFGRWDAKNIKLDLGDLIGPIVLFDKQGNVIVISHFANFMANTMWYDKANKVLSFGVLGAASMVPKDFILYSMVFYSNKGINQALLEWGRLMRQAFRAPNMEYAATDLTNNYLGYYTDDGACYYYYPEANQTFEETLINVKKYADSIKIPYRYIQYDSWFYPKDKRGGVIKWEGIKSFFPNGLPYLFNQTRLPVSAHLKWWSGMTPLAKQHGGPYEFYIDEHNVHALPLDPKFWDDLLRNARQWGTVMFEQDWVGQMFDWMEIFHTNVTVGQRWMRMIGRAAANNGLTMQFGTAYPRHVLAGLMMPTMTQARVSEDYSLENYQWRVGVTGLWSYSLGQVPYKDNFWTTRNQYCRKYPKRRDSYFNLESAVSSLTAGPVGVGDQIGKTDPKLLMKCCNQDGLILKPQRPAFAIDRQFWQSAFKDGSGPEGEVWMTYSNISGGIYGIIFAADLKKPYSITPSTAGLPQAANGLQIFSYKQPDKMVNFSEKTPLLLSGCSKINFCLYYVSSVIATQPKKPLTILGELDKWIPMSPKRVYDVMPDSTGGVLWLTGAEEETVTITMAQTTQIDGDITLVQHTCNLGPTGSAMLNIITGRCFTAPF